MTAYLVNTEQTAMVQRLPFLSLCLPHLRRILEEDLATEDLPDHLSQNLLAVHPNHQPHRHSHQQRVQHGRHVEAPDDSAVPSPRSASDWIARAAVWHGRIIHASDTSRSVDHLGHIRKTTSPPLLNPY